MVQYQLDNPISDNWVMAFVIGMLSAYPTFLPTAFSLKANPEYPLYRRADIETKLIWFPLGFGILHVVIFFLINNFFPPEMQTYWILGFIIGLIYPTLATVGDYAKDVYGVRNYVSLYIGAQILYLAFYGLGINFLFTNICG